jgi:hypothetical protein
MEPVAARKLSAPDVFAASPKNPDRLAVFLVTPPTLAQPGGLLEDLDDVLARAPAADSGFATGRCGGLRWFSDFHRASQFSAIVVEHSPKSQLRFQKNSIHSATCRHYLWRQMAFGSAQLR